MRLSSIYFLLLAATVSCSSSEQEAAMPEDRVDDVIIAHERAALDRWITGDPDGYLALYATDVTYFDPFREKRVDGQEAMQALVAPMRDLKLPFTDARYDMIDPKVERYGDVALLTFNVVNYGKPPGRAETVLARWKATEVYRQIDGAWKIMHSHWSFVKPDVKPPAF